MIVNGNEHGLYIIISTLTVERVMSAHIAEIIGNLKANAMSITKKSKNLRRWVENAILGPENAPKSPKSIFWKGSSRFNPEFFGAKSTQKKLTKKHKRVCRQTVRINYLNAFKISHQNGVTNKQSTT